MINSYSINFFFEKKPIVLLEPLQCETLLEKGTKGEFKFCEISNFLF